MRVWPALLLVLLPIMAAPASAAWHFTDVTAEAGLVFDSDPPEHDLRAASDEIGGVAAGDYDGDGLVDLYVTRGAVGPNLLFRNKGDGTFEEVGAAAGVALDHVHSAGPLFFDFDGDGHLDLFVGGVDGTPVTLFHNNGNGTFTDVTAASGFGVMGNPGPFTFGAAAGDFDGDGDLDLYLTHWAGDLVTQTGSPGVWRLWRNDGAGHFTDVTSAAGLVSLGAGDTFFDFTPNFSDINGDNHPDLLIAADFRTSRIYKNLGNGTFAYATDPTVITDGNGMGAAVGDYDEDGDLDWFVSSIWDPTGNPEGGNWDPSGNRLYRNKGDGTFEDVTEAAGVRAGYWGWGSTFQDFDNDGHLDIFQVNGLGVAGGTPADIFFNDPSRFWHSRGNGTFEEISAALGLDDTAQGRGIVAFDYDGDGDLDIFVNNHGGPSRLFRNDGGNVGKWLDVTLDGRAPNHQGVGAWVKVLAPGMSQLRELRAGSNYESQDPVIAHFGLGVTRQVTVIVRWPDGSQSVREKVSANQHITITQPAAGTLEQTKAQRDCIVGLNTIGARLVTAKSKRLSFCVEAATKGALPSGMTADDCLTSDDNGQLAKAVSQITAVGDETCGLAPTFGPSSAPPVATAMAGVIRPQDVFGSSLDGVLANADTDPKTAACQLALAKGLNTIALAKLKAFNACKTAGVKRGEIASPTALADCRAAQDGTTVQRVVKKAQKAATKRCDGVDLASAAPGHCASTALAAMGQCLDAQAQCGVCKALADGDNLPASCHTYQDGVATLYCGDRPVTNQSIARQWDEELLASIRRDTPRPTTHARNLFHLSGAMWDAWRAFGGGGSAWRVNETHASANPEEDRRIAISFAAYRLLAYRFATGPSMIATQAELKKQMYALGLDTTYTTTVGDTPAAVGNRIGAAVIAFGMNDGANETGNYTDPSYVPVNAPMVVAKPGTVLVDPNRWQPLALSQIVTQNGISQPGSVQVAIGTRWAQVTPFALTRANPNDVYIDPGPPPQLGGADDAGYKEGARRVVELTSRLTPDDGQTIDISPGAYGNNSLGANDGTGHPLNPVTGQPYAPNVVPRGDFGRVLAEFWADGPNSETPPGHWNVLANTVSDSPLCTHQLGGTGPSLNRLEWDVKMYFTLNGAVHDAAIAAWGLKKKYDSVRPISMIRYLGGNGQSSDPGGPSYSPNGLPLTPGLIEVITSATTAPGQRHAALAGHEGEIAVFSWPGSPASPTTQHSGVRWMRAVEWIPYQKKTFVTPAFPAFMSGHSTFSRAAAQVMTRFTGSAYFPGGLGQFVAKAHKYLTFEEGPTVDVALQWGTYYDAADQAGQSRLWGGIHVTADDFNGRISGSQVGDGAMDKALQYFAGTIAP